jgi:hypothetical protein
LTDQSHSYWGLDKQFAAHETVDHTFRWNRRKMTDSERLVEAVAGTEGTRLYYRAPSFLEGVQKSS